MNRVEFFFQILRGLYGAGKMSVTWPTDLDLQLAKKLWADDINRHTEEELRGAIDNAKKQIQKGEEEFSWPNIGLILSGAKGPRKNSPDVVALLAQTETPEQKRERIDRNLAQVAGLKALLQNKNKPTEANP